MQTGLTQSSFCQCCQTETGVTVRHNVFFFQNQNRHESFHIQGICFGELMPNDHNYMSSFRLVEIKRPNDTFMCFYFLLHFGSIILWCCANAGLYWSVYLDLDSGSEPAGAEPVSQTQLGVLCFRWWGGRGGWGEGRALIWAFTVQW